MSSNTKQILFMEAQNVYRFLLRYASVRSVRSEIFLKHNGRSCTMFTDFFLQLFALLVLTLCCMAPFGVANTNANFSKGVI